MAEGRLTDDDQRQATRHLGQNRVLKIRYDLISWRRFIPVPFREMTAGDLYAGLNAMKACMNVRGTPFKQNTKHDLIILLKPFVLWLIENGDSGIPAEKIRAIRRSTTTRPRRRRCSRPRRSRPCSPGAGPSGTGP